MLVGASVVAVVFRHERAGLARNILRRFVCLPRLCNGRVGGKWVAAGVQNPFLHVLWLYVAFVDSSLVTLLVVLGVSKMLALCFCWRPCETFVDVTR